MQAANNKIWQVKALVCQISFLIIVLHPCEIQTSYFILLLRMSASMLQVRVIALILSDSCEESVTQHAQSAY